MKHTLQKELKKSARTALKGHISGALCISLTVGIFYFTAALAEDAAIILSGSSAYWSALNVPQPNTAQLIRELQKPALISLSAFLASIFLISPLKLGEKRWYISAAKREYHNIKSVFIFFKSIKSVFKSAVCTFISTVLALFWGILFFFLPFCIFSAAMRSLYSAETSFFSSLLFTSLFPSVIFSYTMFSVFMKRYFLVQYILADNISSPLFHAFKTSADMMRGFKAELFYLEFSFVWLRVLNFLIIPAVYTVPYINSAKAEFANMMFAHSLTEHAKRSDFSEATRIFPLSGEKPSAV